MRCMAKSLLLTSVLLLSGCVTLGPKVETKTIRVNGNNEKGEPVKIGYVKKNIRVPVQYETVKGEIGTAEIDIGGWEVVPPKENK